MVCIGYYAMRSGVLFSIQMRGQMLCLWSYSPYHDDVAAELLEEEVFKLKPLTFDLQSLSNPFPRPSLIFFRDCVILCATSRAKSDEI